MSLSYAEAREFAKILFSTQLSMPTVRIPDKDIESSRNHCCDVDGIQMYLRLVGHKTVEPQANSAISDGDSHIARPPAKVTLKSDYDRGVLEEWCSEIAHVQLYGGVGAHYVAGGICDICTGPEKKATIAWYAVANSNVPRKIPRIT